MASFFSKEKTAHRVLRQLKKVVAPPCAVRKRGEREKNSFPVGKEEEDMYCCISSLYMLVGWTKQNSGGLCKSPRTHEYTNTHYVQWEKFTYLYMCLWLQELCKRIKGDY